MRTKTLVMTAAAMVAGVLASSAQVYSANVVGYVTKAFPADYSQYFVCTPLDDGTNTLKSLFPSAPDQTTIICWDAGNQDFDSIKTYTYQAGAKAWTDGNNVIVDPLMYPGQGYFVATSTAFTNTFVGNVLQGSLTNGVPISGNYSMSFIGSMVPVGGAITNVMAGYAPNDQDTIQLWDANVQDWSAVAYTWQAGAGVWDPPMAGNGLEVGQGISYMSTKDSDAKWVRQFVVQ